MAYAPEIWAEFDTQTGNLPKGVPHPTRSLGYQILRWAETYIVQPDGDDAGEPWRFTREQKRFILWMYAIDEHGRWLYRDISLRRAKGWGKTPLLAALAIIEFIGPSRFSHWDEHGRPVGKRVALPLVHLAAVSLDQTANTRDMIRGMLANSPAEIEFDLELGKERIQFRDGSPGRIEPVTSSSRGLEGARPTFVLADETHHWLESNGGHAVFQTLDRNIGKSLRYGARLVQTTNAFNPNEDSIAQRTFEAALAGKKGLLYDCVEGIPLTNADLRDEETVRRALWQAYGDSHWASVDELVEKAQDPMLPIAEFFRFYLNQIAETADAWLPKEVWLKLKKDDDPLKPGDVIALGFDGSLYHDATALVASRIRDGHMAVLGVWQRPADLPPSVHWEVPVPQVNDAVELAFETYTVAWMFGDPSHWQNPMGDWATAHQWLGDRRKPKDVVFEFSPQRKLKMAEAIERFETAARLGLEISFDGDERFTDHVTNAVNYETPSGKLIRKEHKKSKRKIDIAMAAILAYEARAEAIADGRTKLRKGAKMRSY